MNTNETATPTRRTFLKTSSLAGATVALAPHIAKAGAANNETLKIGLIGCGGRGTGAATQALRADKNVKLWALADAFEPKLNNSLQGLKAGFAEKVDVPKERQFIGVDAYEQLLASGVDVVLIATPPGFRPQHLRAAIEAGKHVFAEKPVAVDMAGIHSVLKTAEMAEAKGLSIQQGFCWRTSPACREGFAKVLSGEFGRITGFYGTYMGGPVRPLAPDAKKPEGMGDVEWQMRNWINFQWLSGGPLIEQCIHAIDKLAWAMGDKDPVAAVANGGRAQITGPSDNYDHYSIAYEYPNGMFCHINQRWWRRCYGENISRVVCEGGTFFGPWKCYIDDPDGKRVWTYKREKNVEQDMYQIEHNELFAGIRSGKIVQFGKQMARSTALGLLGREAAQTGKRLTWEAHMKSTEDLAPDKLNFGDDFPIKPAPIPGQPKIA